MRTFRNMLCLLSVNAKPQIQTECFFMLQLYVCSTYLFLSRRSAVQRLWSGLGTKTLGQS